MRTSRSRLHKSKLPYFITYLEGCGWVQEPCKGDFEVLRMRRDGNKDPLLVYDRINAKEHYTTHGIAEFMLDSWLSSLKAINDV